MKDSQRLQVFYNELTQPATNVIFFNRPRWDGGACFSVISGIIAIFTRNNDKSMSSKTPETLKVELIESPLFNLSLTNKELFHSNFLAWFGNTYNKEFKDLINQLLGFKCWPKDLQSFSILREYKHFDICIIDGNGNPVLLIENKVKSVPTKNS